MLYAPFISIFFLLIWTINHILTLTFEPLTNPNKEKKKYGKKRTN
jgi:hypothetical protein